MKTSNNSKPLTISSNLPAEVGMNFEELVNEGTKAIQKLAWEVWTNYNPSDPGITILEHLCYAITDLSYRLTFPMHDLLANKKSEAGSLTFTARNIFSTSSVTVNDYRRLLLDILGVKNVWIEKHSPIEKSTEGSVQLLSKGLYRIKIQPEKDANWNGIVKIAQETLHKNRNLGEDFTVIEEVKPISISITASIEVSDDAPLPELYKELYIALDEFLSPNINFYSLDELLKDGMQPEEIFSSPHLDHGFIKEDELEEFSQKSKIYLADIISLIYKNPKVKVIKEISLKEITETITTPLILESLTINNTQVDKPKKEKSLKNQDIDLPIGFYRNLKDYTLIQDELPQNYGLAGSSSSTPKRIAQVKQLKAYMLFYDQILANYFAQLDNAKELFNPSTALTQTYFSQVIADKSLLEQDQATLDKLLFGSVDTNQRKNRLLDHLLAMFGESFTDYSEFLGKTKEHIIATKIKWLQNYPQMSSMRGKGINYKINDERTIELQNRIADLLCISQEKFYIIEHVLLRPFQDLEKGQYLADFIGYDPYSCQISFIFDGKLFADSRDTVKEIIGREIPAHLGVNVRWLPAAPANIKFQEFGKIYNDWLRAIATNPTHYTTWVLSKQILSVCVDQGFKGIGIMQIGAEPNSGEETFTVV